MPTSLIVKFSGVGMEEIGHAEYDSEQGTMTNTQTTYMFATKKTFKSKCYQR